MKSTGHSDKSLVEKLEIKAGLTVLILNPPPEYESTLGKLPDRVHFKTRPAPNLDFIQYFARTRHDLASEFPGLKRLISTTGALWISWPKQSSVIKTDLSDNVVREIGLKNGLVDIKVCAIDETWSALKFVYRRADVEVF
jgi:hypothetical protein